MSKSVLGTRMIQKLTDVFDVSPFGNNPGENYNTIGDDHTMGWPDNAIYKGELFLNTYENRAWTRTDHGIIEFIMEDKDTGKIPDRFMPDIIVGTGTVTSVNLSAPVGFTVLGGPITTSGILELKFSAGYSLPTTSSQSNWDTAYNHSQNTTTSVHGSTTVGSNLLRLVNPDNISFIRINADNTISTLDAESFKTAIGIVTGTTVTSVTAGNGMDFTDITSTGQVTMGLPSDITPLTSNSLTSNSHTHKFVPAGSDGHIQYKMSGNLVSSSALKFDGDSLYISGTTYNENDHMLYFDQSNGKITYGNKPQSIITGITYINTSEVIIDSYDSSLNNYQVYHYCVYSGTTNLRAGTIVLVNNTIISNIVDTSTNDIGDTSNISFSSDINSGNVRLKILSSNGEWYCKFIKLID